MFFGSDNHDKYGDPDDFFADTRMSFGEHIEDLRKHLIRAILGFLLILSLCFALDGLGYVTGLPIGGGKPVLAFIAKPVEDQLGEFYDRRQKVLMDEAINDIKVTPDLQPHVVKQAFLVEDLEKLGLKVDGSGLERSDDSKYVLLRMRQTPAEDMERFAGIYKKLGPKPQLKTMNVTEAFMVYFKVCMVTGFVLGSPWIFYQVWAFIAAGLYPHERRYVNVYLPFSLGLFLVGVAMCEFLVLPRAVEALLWFNEWLNLEPDMRLNEWLGFAILLPVIFGLAFQTPLVMLFLERIGLGSIDSYRKMRRISWFAMAVMAAVFTPTPDAYTMLLLWVPMCLFYEMGIWLCMLYPRKAHTDLDVPESEEMVEV